MAEGRCVNLKYARVSDAVRPQRFHRRSAGENWSQHTRGCAGVPRRRKELQEVQKLRLVKKLDYEKKTKTHKKTKIMVQ